MGRTVVGGRGWIASLIGLLFYLMGWMFRFVRHVPLASFIVVSHSHWLHISPGVFGSDSDPMRWTLHGLVPMWMANDHDGSKAILLIRTLVSIYFHSSLRFHGGWDLRSCVGCRTLVHTNHPFFLSCISFSTVLGSTCLPLCCWCLFPTLHRRTPLHLRFLSSIVPLPSCPTHEPHSHPRPRGIEGTGGNSLHSPRSSSTHPVRIFRK